MIKQIKTNDPAYREYHTNLENLTSEELELIEILKKASKQVGLIYKKQENPNFDGANFYPHDATREEIEEAAKKDKMILDPYTVVKRNSDGSLYAVPFHEEYKDDFKPLIKLLEEAIEFSSKMKGYDSFGAYLNTAIKAFKGELNNSYVLEDYIKVTGNNVDFLIGFLEPYSDRLFNMKCPFDSDVRVKAPGSYYTKEYLEIAWNTISSGGSIANKDEQSKVTIRVDSVICYAGSAADFITSGANYPMEVEQMKRQGLKILIYTTGIKHKLFDKGIDIFDGVFSSQLKNQFNESMLVDGFIRRTMMHEIAEAVTKYSYDLSKFQDYNLPLQELNADMMSLKILGIHMLTGATTDEQLRSAILAFVIRSIIDYKNLMQTSQNNIYATARSAVIKRMLETGAIYKPKFLPSKFNVDFYKAYKVIEALADEVHAVIASEDREEGEKYIKQNVNINIFKEFEHLI